MDECNTRRAHAMYTGTDCFLHVLCGHGEMQMINANSVYQYFLVMQKRLFYII